MSRSIRGSGPARLRYFLMVSVAYVALGVIIVARSILAHVMPLILLGVVFIALGVVRLRDYSRRQEPPS